MSSRNKSEFAFQRKKKDTKIDEKRNGKNSNSIEPKSSTKSNMQINSDLLNNVNRKTMRKKNSKSEKSKQISALDNYEEDVRRNGEFKNNPRDTENLNSNVTRKQSNEFSEIEQKQPGMKSSIRDRYWQYLFDNLERSICEIHQTCENDNDIRKCKVTI